MKKNLLTIVAAFAVMAFASCDKNDDPTTPPVTSNNIVDIVSTSADFSILKGALERAGLVDAIKTSNNITVFAPDNTAFANSGLDAAAVNSLPVETLQSILLYHVVGAKVMAAQVPASDTVKTLANLNLYASSNANGVFVNGIKVKTADVAADNGVIHVIDKVLMPPTTTIAGIAAADANFTLLVAAVQKAGLLDAISQPGKYTVFAPTNAAFQAAGFNTVDDINNAPDETIATVVKYHVLTTNVFASDLIDNATATTLQGGTLTIGTTPPSVKVTGSANDASQVTTADIVATNGVIHVIDKVILP